MPFVSHRASMRLAASLVFAAVTAGAQAQVLPAPFGRTSSYVGVDYASGLSFETTFGGETYSGSTWSTYLSDYQQRSDALRSEPPELLVAQGIASGDPLRSPATVAAMAWAGSAAGVNQVRAQVSGFESKVWSTNTTIACTTLDGVHCLPGQPAQTQRFSGNNYAAATAITDWSDAFRTAGRAGVLTLSFDARAKLSAEPDGVAYLYWSQTSSDGEILANIWAGVDGRSGQWTLDVFSNLDGMRSLSGTGPLSFGAGAVALSSDGATFDGTLRAGLDVAGGDRFGLAGSLQAYLGGNALVDVSDGIRLIHLSPPAGGSIQSLSGIDYSQLVSAGGPGNGLAAPVSEPMPAVMLLSGLAMLAWLRRRRDAA